MTSCCKQTLPSMMKKLSIALVQLQVGKDKTANLNRAFEKIKEANSERKLDLVALPECFNSPYGINFFQQYAETIPDGSTSKMLSEAAKEYKIHLIGGTIPEKDGDSIYNTCTVWNPEGKLVGKYRKMHLFDIDIPGKITFKESEVLKAGNDLFMFQVNSVKIGLGICYDLRFNELATLYRKKGCDMIVYPGAFNMTTGPAHWEVLQRARAIDYQVFVCAISPARSNKGYIAWGHSQITNPWGDVKSLDAEEGILYDEIDFQKSSEIREQIPIFNQKRNDIYEIVEKK